MARSSNNGRENGSGGIISAKTGFTHAGTIINDQGCNFLVAHDDDRRAVGTLKQQSIWTIEVDRLGSSQYSVTLGIHSVLKDAYLYVLSLLIAPAVFIHAEGPRVLIVCNTQQITLEQSY